MDASGRITGRPVNTGDVSHTSSSEGAPFSGREVSVGEGEGARVPTHEADITHVSITQRDVQVMDQEEGDGLSHLESLPPELRQKIAGDLDPQALLALSQTSTTMKQTSVKEGMIRLLGPAFDGDGGLARSEHASDRMEAVRGATGMLAYTRLSQSERVGLLNVLVGVNGADGLAQDPDPRVRQACIKAIGSLLVQGAPGVRDRLVGALIGGAHGLGLVHDSDPSVATYAAGLLGNLLQYEGLGEGFKNSLLTPIVGEGRHKGMIYSKNPSIQAGALKVIGNLMLKGGLDPEVRKQFLTFILGDGRGKGLTHHPDAAVRKAAFNCLGSLLRSDSASSRFKAWICDVVIGQDGIKGGLVRDKNPSVSQSANELVGTLLRSDSGLGQMERIKLVNFQGSARHS